MLYPASIKTKTWFFIVYSLINGKKLEPVENGEKNRQEVDSTYQKQAKREQSKVQAQQISSPYLVILV